MVGESTAARYVDSSFYDRANASSQIMRLVNFPDGILPFLQMENLATREAATTFGCSVIVEFGCYDGRALEVARFSGTNYLGVDTDECAVRRLQQRIAKERLSRLANAVVGDALDPSTWCTSVVWPKPLHLLPFNLLGTFAQPQRLITSVSKVGGLAIFSVFDSSRLANAVRTEYYTKCGIRGLERKTLEDGNVLFTGADGFYSRSFDERSMHLLMVKTGATILRTVHNSVGQCVTVVLDAQEIVQPNAKSDRDRTLPIPQ